MPKGVGYPDSAPLSAANTDSASRRKIRKKNKKKTSKMELLKKGNVERMAKSENVKIRKEAEKELARRKRMSKSALTPYQRGTRN